MDATNVLWAFAAPVIAATGMNLTASVFIAPFVQKDEPGTNSWLIFAQLCLISLCAIIAGAIITAYAAPELWGSLLALGIIYMIAEVVMNAHRHTQLVGFAVAIPALYVGEVAITGDFRQTMLLTVGASMAMLFLAVIYVVLRLIRKQVQP